MVSRPDAGLVKKIALNKQLNEAIASRKRGKVVAPTSQSAIDEGKKKERKRSKRRTKVSTDVNKQACANLRKERCKSSDPGEGRGKTYVCREDKVVDLERREQNFF